MLALLVLVLGLQVVTLAVIGYQARRARTHERSTQMTLAELQAEVERNTAVDQSAITLLAGLSAQLDAALASGDPLAVQWLADTLRGSTDQLANAVTANTPTPVPVPEPV